MKRELIDNLKNIPGWRTSERLVVLAVDDYGSVRLNSKQARENLAQAGLSINSRFDRLDTLETRRDLDALFEVLSGVSDAAGNPALMTCYSLSANPDFDQIRRNGDRYEFEKLPATFDHLSASQPDAYEGAWALWQDGIAEGLLRPQFHGREHLNVELFERKLKAGDRGLQANIQNRSLVAIGSEPSMPGVRFTQAFEPRDPVGVERHGQIIASGIELFESIFGFAPTTFTPPAQQLHPDLYSFVESHGVLAIDKPLRCVRRLDKDAVKREWNKLGIRRGQKHVTMVRNVVFEPTNNPAFDSVRLALDQIGAAFRWRKPAIISSHRVNYCGHIDPKNREKGLAALKRLVVGIVNRWPDVQFLSADELADKVLESV